MINKNIDRKDLARSFKSSETGHVAIESLFDSEFIKECEREFLQIDESEFFRYSDRQFEYDKYSMNSLDKMPESLKKLFSYIHSEEFVRFVEEVTGIESLIVDEKRWGGGLHMTKPGGYLSIHKDFNVLPDSYCDSKQLLRCINLIGYLTDEDQSQNDGQLELWGEGKIQKIENSFNRWVLFERFRKRATRSLREVFLRDHFCLNRRACDGRFFGLDNNLIRRRELKHNGDRVVFARYHNELRHVRNEAHLKRIRCSDSVESECAISTIHNSANTATLPAHCCATQRCKRTIGLTTKNAAA